MRQSGSEKLETIRVVEDSELSVTATLRELGVPWSTFYGTLLHGSSRRMPYHRVFQHWG